MAFAVRHELITCDHIICFSYAILQMNQVVCMDSFDAGGTSIRVIGRGLV